MRDVWRRSLSSGTIVKSIYEFCWKKNNTEREVLFYGGR